MQNQYIGIAFVLTPCTIETLFILNSDDAERRRSQARKEYIAHEKAINNKLAKLSEVNAVLVSEKQALDAKNQALTAENQALTAENQALTTEKQTWSAERQTMVAEIERLRAQLAADIRAL